MILRSLRPPQRSLRGSQFNAECTEMTQRKQTVTVAIRRKTRGWQSL